MKIIFIKYSEDFWSSKNGSFVKLDKLEHFLIGLLATLSIPHILSLLPLLSPHFIAVNALTALLSVFAALWQESRDGRKAYSGLGLIEGWSWKDLIAGFAGIAIGFSINFLAWG